MACLTTASITGAPHPSPKFKEPVYTRLAVGGIRSAWQHDPGHG